MAAGVSTALPVCRLAEFSSAARVGHHNHGHNACCKQDRADQDESAESRAPFHSGFTRDEAVELLGKGEARGVQEVRDRPVGR